MTDPAAVLAEMTEYADASRGFIVKYEWCQALAQQTARVEALEQFVARVSLIALGPNGYCSQPLANIVADATALASSGGEEK